MRLKGCAVLKSHTPFSARDQIFFIDLILQVPGTLFADKEKLVALLIVNRLRAFADFNDDLLGSAAIFGERTGRGDSGWSRRYGRGIFASGEAQQRQRSEPELFEPKMPEHIDESPRAEPTCHFCLS